MTSQKLISRQVIGPESPGRSSLVVEGRCRVLPSVIQAAVQLALYSHVPGFGETQDVILKVSRRDRFGKTRRDLWLNYCSMHLRVEAAASAALAVRKVDLFLGKERR